MTFDQQIGRLVTSYGRSIDDGMAFEYSRALGEVPIEVLERAIDRAIDSRKFLPNVAELIEDVNAVLSEQPMNMRATEPFKGCELCAKTGWREQVIWYAAPVMRNGQVMAPPKTKQLVRCECFEKWRKTWSESKRASMYGIRASKT